MATGFKGSRAPLLRGVPYDWYVRLRDDDHNRHLRMTHVDGALDVMSPEYRHESDSDRLGVIVRAFASAFGVACTGSRSTTFRRGKAGTARGRGKEPDLSFYFANAPAIRGKRTIDLDVDPPPDLWVEVDNRASSRGGLPLYAALGVPEVWRPRSRRRSLWFGRLEGGGYVEYDRGLSLPMVSPEVVLALLDRAREAPDETSWGDWMRDWLGQTFRPSYDAGSGPVLP